MTAAPSTCNELNHGVLSESELGNVTLDHDAIFAYRREKGFAATTAVADVLNRKRPLNGGEDQFLSIWQWLMDREDSQTEVYSDPYFYYWSRMAFQLLGLHLETMDSVPSVERYMQAIGTSDVAEALEGHLELFKSFALGKAWEDNATLMFEKPFVVQLPWAMPTSPWSIDGTGVCYIHGIRGRDAICISSSDGDFEIPLNDAQDHKFANLKLCRAPQVGNADFSIFMQPHCLNMPGMGASLAEFSRVGTDFQWQSKNHLVRALTAIQRVSPNVYSQLTTLMKNYILKPETVGKVFNTSCSRLTGLSIITCYESPYVLAEDLIHEFNHNVLFALEDQGEFFVEGDIDPVNDQQFYSPWRDDPRPLYGLFHAYFVFTRVADFWCNVLEDTMIKAIDREFACNRIALLDAQLQLVDEQLSRFTELTSLGQEVFEATRSIRDQIRTVIGEKNLSMDIPALEPHVDGTFTAISDSAGNPISVRERFQNHLASWDIFERCRKNVSSEKR